MKRPVISFVNALILLLFPFFGNATGAKVSADYPSTVSAGTEFLMSIRIEKGSVNSNGRLQLDLPQGFNCRSVNSRGAEYEFSGSVAKLYWNQLPEAPEITVTLSVKAPSLLKGKQTIYGEFVYNNGDQTEHIPVQPIILNVEGEETAQATPKPDPVVEPKPKGPTVDRKIITISENKGEYRVELTFSLNNTREAAQFTDILPPGYSALVIDAHEASYSFENQSVIFRWKLLPDDPSFVVSYLVRAEAPGKAPSINGTLVYGDAVEINPIATGQVPASPPQTNTDRFANTGQHATENEAPHERLVTEEDASNSAPNSSASASTSASPYSSGAAVNTANGITFRVQIAATQKCPTRNSDWFEKRFDIPNLVDVAQDNGWKKYLIGNFGDYPTATKFKNETREKIPGAFIVAYQFGQRIPVSDAIRNKALNQ